MTPPPRGDEALAGRKIMVVEDDSFIAADLADLLAGLGAEVLGPVPTVTAALALLAARRPDAALLDVNLRGHSSAPVAEAMRAQDVPILLLTGYSRGQLDHPVLRDAPLLPKPVHGAELARSLNRALSGEPV